MSDFDELLALTHGARPDPQRQARTGVPEVVLADCKTSAQTLAIVQSLLDSSQRAIVSRATPEVLAALHEHYPGMVEAAASGSTAVVRAVATSPPPWSGGRVGILSAGTSDIPVAEEAALLCRELGCRVRTAYDVGVAGLHRLHRPLAAMMGTDSDTSDASDDTPVDVLIVVAGMDGALPSVVAGLVHVPVIGLPTSVGYGLGGGGVAALLGMLQTCAPGLAVVNIDNGIGAGALAARIANQVAHARTRRNEHQEDEGG